MIKKLFLFLLPLLFVFSVQAAGWPPEIKPEQGRAGWKTPVPDSYDGRILGESYTEVLFWNVGAVSADPAHAKASVTNDCAKSTVPGCSGGGTVYGTFSGGPNGVLTVSGYEYTLHDGQYFEGVSGGKTFKFNVENPEIFSKYNWEATAKESALEDSGARFSHISGHVEIIPPGGTEDDRQFATPRTVLLKGTRIITGDGENDLVILTFSDQSTLVMKSESEIIIQGTPSPATPLEVLGGNIKATFKKILSGEGAEVKTLHSVTSIKGTTIVLQVTQDATSLKVIEGAVSFKSKTSGQSETVNSGETLAADKNGLGQKNAFDRDEEEKKWKKITNNNTMLYILGGVIVAVVIIGLLVAKIRKKNRST